MSGTNRQMQITVTPKIQVYCPFCNQLNSFYLGGSCFELFGLKCYHLDSTEQKYGRFIVHFSDKEQNINERQA